MNDAGRDRPGYAKRVLLDLVGSAWVLVPTAAGFTAIMADWAGGGGAGWGAWLGVTGLLVGAGALATRWLTGADRIAERVAAEELEREAAARRARLQNLDRRLKADDDRTTNQALAGLVDLERRLEALTRPAKGKPSAPPELVSKARELIESSLHSLERAADLHEMRSRVITDEARQRIETARLDVIDEVVASITQIIRTLDGLHTLGLDRNRPEGELARMRRELDQSLEVARRVERRMVDLEHRLDGPSQTWEDDGRDAASAGGPSAS